jgi:hypothetical protein
MLNLWHGCAAPAEDEPERENFSFAILEHEVRQGRCLASLEPEAFECHVFLVRVNNTESYYREFRVGWEAIDDQGRDWKDEVVDGEASAEAGASVTVRFGITTDPGVRLVQLRYHGYQELATRPVPSMGPA